MSESNNGIVISSRVRLARNLDGFVFPARLDDAGSAKVLGKIEDALKGGSENFGTIRISDMTDLQAETLKELHVISDDLLHYNKNAAVIVNKAGDICIMVNEEDHLREQCILKGNKLSQAYNKLCAVDDLIASANKIAFDQRLGYHIISFPSYTDYNKVRSVGQTYKRTPIIRDFLFLSFEKEKQGCYSLFLSISSQNSSRFAFASYFF